jgi:cytochrome c
VSFDPDNVVVRISDTLTQIKPSDLDRAEPCPPGFDPAQRQNVRRGYFCSDGVVQREGIIIIRLAIIFFLAGTSVSFGQEGEQSALEKHGQALAERMCSECHSAGRSGRSPHAGAPPLREVGRRLDLDFLPERLRDGLMAGHPDMPTFRFTREDARAFVLYLRSIQTP